MTGVSLTYFTVGALFAGTGELAVLGGACVRACVRACCSRRVIADLSHARLGVKAGKPVRSAPLSHNPIHFDPFSLSSTRRRASGHGRQRPGPVRRDGLLRRRPRLLRGGRRVDPLWLRGQPVLGARQLGACVALLGHSPLTNGCW
jgi:hypothetical protein